MTTRLLILTTIALVVPSAGAFQGAAPDAPLEQWLLGFYEDPELRAGELYGAGRVIEFIDDLFIVVVETRAPSLLQAHAALDERVRYAEPNDQTAAFLDMTPDDPKWSDAGHYGAKVIGATTAWDKTVGTTAVKLAVIDSGLKKTHEDITGSRVLQGYDFVNSDTDPQDTSGCSYHGSHVTGTAAATINNAKGIAGIAQSQILPIRAFYQSLIWCTSSDSILVNSIKYAADQGAHVASNSWGGASSTSVKDAVTYSYNKGVTQVAAAGNSGSCTNCVSEPWKSKASQVVVVSCTDSADAFCSFSSQGPEVDVAAPGKDILSVDGAGTTGYKKLSGTSMSTPHVSGVAALIKTINSGYTFNDIQSRLTSTAKDLGSAGKDDTFGYGRVDAAKAVY